MWSYRFQNKFFFLNPLLWGHSASISCRELFDFQCVLCSKLKKEAISSKYDKNLKLIYINEPWSNFCEFWSVYSSVCLLPLIKVMTVVLVLWDPIQSLYTVCLMGRNDARNARSAQYLKILRLELLVCLNKVNTGALRIFFILFESPSIFPDPAKTKFLLF